MEKQHNDIIENSACLLADCSDKDHDSFAHISKSFEIVQKSIDLRADNHKTLPKENPMLGYIFMIMFVLGVTANHLFAKIAYFNNPRLTNFDCLLFLGIVVAPSYFCLSTLNGYSLKCMHFPKKAKIALFMSVSLAVAINLTMLYGISLIPVGKSTLVFSLNPIFCILLAHYINKYIMIYY